jgi:uncharacterized membrane protein (UPF0127 family)
MLHFDNIEIKDAIKFKDRLFGLMFKKNINYGILFRNCRAIHTFFMLEKIDIIATDKNDKIIKKYINVAPWRILITPKNTKNIYELPKDTLK